MHASTLFRTTRRINRVADLLLMRGSLVTFFDFNRPDVKCKKINRFIV